MKTMRIRNLIAILLLSVRCFSQTTFTLKEYTLNPSFYQDLCSVVFSDTVYGADISSVLAFAMYSDTLIKHYDYFTGEYFSASFCISDLIDELSILSATDAGRKAIGYFYLKDKICFIIALNRINSMSEYLSITDKKKEFVISDPSPSIGGVADVYMNILPKGRIDVVRILRYE